MKGLRNCGNTCYFNTSLQCLLSIPVLSNHLIDHPYSGECEFTKLYSQLVHIYWNKTQEGVINVEALLRAFQRHFPRFIVGQQHDAQEAILCMMDILEKQITEIKQWFYGKKVQEVVWPGGKTSTEEDFCIHLTNSNGRDMGEMLRKSTEWGVVENFEDKEGKIHHLATTRMLFSKLPKILLISFDTKSYLKIIEKLYIDRAEYNLISSAIHTGIQYDGHYVSFIKHKGLWYYINDDVVQQQNLPSEAGYYVLVYNLKTPSS